MSVINNLKKGLFFYIPAQMRCLASGRLVAVCPFNMASEERKEVVELLLENKKV